MSEVNIALHVDASGLPCPMPLLKAKQAMHQVAAGEMIAIVATDAGSWRDIPAWCALAGHTIVEQHQQDERFQFVIRKLGGQN